MYKVLAVDDDPGSLQQIREVLKELEYFPGILAAPEFLFERLGEEKFDLILLDIYMPKIDGITLLKQLNLHKDYRKIPIIMLTGETNQKQIVECFESGAKDYIHKPIQTVELKARIQAALNEKIFNDLKQQTMEKLQQANETAQAGIRVKDHFIANVSHEIGTPLTVVKGYIQMLLLQYDKISESKKINYLKRINNAINNLSDLVSNILDFSQFESGSINLILEKINLVSLFPEIEEAFTILTEEEDKEMTFSIPDKCPKVYVDKKRLKQILFNLIGNAVKFSNKGGRIKVEANILDYEIEISVDDNGIGIPERFKEQVFERFTRSENAEHMSGTGIGLTITKQLIEAMNGKIWFESRLEKGTVFHITLPQVTNRTNSTMKGYHD